MQSDPEQDPGWREDHGVQVRAVDRLVHGPSLAQHRKGQGKGDRLRSSVLCVDIV